MSNNVQVFDVGPYNLYLVAVYDPVTIEDTFVIFFTQDEWQTETHLTVYIEEWYNALSAYHGSWKEVPQCK